MIVFPDIEIQNGQSVNRTRGRENEPEVYDVSPLDAARGFAEAGAEWLHVIDLDSSYQHGHVNAELICEIINAVDIPVQVGGGIRTQTDVDWWLEHGAARVVIGTVAVLDRLFIMEACGRHPGKIVVSITGKDGYAMIDGWSTKTSFTALALAKSFEDTGAAAIIYTDLDRFEGGQEFGLAATIEIGTELSIPLISTGTISTLEDISTLALLPNIEGAISGRALYHGKLDLAEAIHVARASRVAPELANEGVAPKLEEVSGIPIKSIDHVGITISDLERSLSFYEKLGFNKESKREFSKNNAVAMRHGSGVAISLLSQKPGDQNNPAVALEVESILKTRAFLEYNGIEFTEVHHTDSHTVISFTDPDGNLIELNRYL